MNTLNLGSDDEPVVKKKSNTRNLKIALGLAAVILVPTIGSTLAGSITVSGGSGITFGQGLVQATSCDGEISVAAATTFDNAASAGSFPLGTITLSALADACSGKTFTIRAFSDSSDTPLTLSSGGSTTTGLVFVPTLASSCTVAAQASANHSGTCTYSLNASSVVITLVTVVAASDILKFTVETA